MHVGANFRAELDHRLVQLRFDVLLQYELSIRQNLLDVRTQFASPWIDDLKFFLDTNGKDSGFFNSSHAVAIDFAGIFFRAESRSSRQSECAGHFSSWERFALLLQGATHPHAVFAITFRACLSASNCAPLLSTSLV